MNLKRWILAGTFPLLLFFAVATAKTNQLRGDAVFQSQTENTIDMIEGLGNPVHYRVALDEINRYTTLATRELASLTISAAERRVCVQQWLDVAKVYAIHGRELGLPTEKLRADLNPAEQRILAARPNDREFAANLHEGFHNVLILAAPTQ